LQAVDHNSKVRTAYQIERDDILWISRAAAVALIIMYALFIWFQLVSHKHLFEGESDDEEDEEPELSILTSTLVLLISTTLVAIFSEMLAGSIEGSSPSGI